MGRRKRGDGRGRDREIKKERRRLERGREGKRKERGKRERDEIKREKGEEAEREKGREKGEKTQNLEEKKLAINREDRMRHEKRHFWSTVGGQPALRGCLLLSALIPLTAPQTHNSPCLPTVRCQKKWE